MGTSFKQNANAAVCCAPGLTFSSIPLSVTADDVVSYLRVYAAFCNTYSFPKLEFFLFLISQLSCPLTVNYHVENSLSLYFEWHSLIRIIVDYFCISRAPTGKGMKGVWGTIEIFSLKLDDVAARPWLISIRAAYLSFESPTPNRLYLLFKFFIHFKQIQ
jgi:hypothetical protein